MRILVRPGSAAREGHFNLNAFEELVAALFRREGFWTHPSYKVALTKEEKREVKRPSLPRIEIDILAYRAKSNTLYWVECKSYLDSPGVQMSNFDDEHGPYKVFANKRLRSVAAARLVIQVVEQGLTRANPKVKFCLVAGHVVARSRQQLEERFRNEGWELRTERWIKDHLTEMADAPYEDDVAMMVAKLNKIEAALPQA